MADRVGKVIKLCLVRRQGRCACLECIEVDDLTDWRGATTSDLPKIDFAHRHGTPKPMGLFGTWNPVIRGKHPFHSLRTGLQEMILHCELAHKQCHEQHDRRNTVTRGTLPPEAMYGENVRTRGARVPICVEVDGAFAAVPHWRTDPSWRDGWDRG